MNTMDPKKFYNETMPEKLGANYEQARWHTDAFQEAQYDMMCEVMRRVVAPQIQGAQSILEVGPGPGTWTRFLLEANPRARYTLADISAEMLVRAKANLPSGYSLYFVESDFLELNTEKKFDIVFSSRAIEYMPDKSKLTQKLATLIIPGGRVVLITKMPKRFFDRILGRKNSDLHQGQVAPDELKKLLLNAGFHSIHVRMATATVPGFKSPFLNRLAFRLFSGIPLIWLTAVFSESYSISATRV